MLTKHHVIYFIQSLTGQSRIFSNRRIEAGTPSPTPSCRASPPHLLPDSHWAIVTMISRAAAPSSTPLASLSSRSLRLQAPAARSFATVSDNAPPVHHHGGLKDQDRIFTNLYGHHGADLKSAMKYGDWYRTKDIVLKGHDWVGSRRASPRHGIDSLANGGYIAHLRTQGLWPAWSWRCWFSLWTEIRMSLPLDFPKVSELV